MLSFNSIYIWAFCAFLATLAGASLLQISPNWARKQIWRILALTSGVLLGVGFLKILPEAVSASYRFGPLGIVSGFLLLFTLEAFTMTHSCSEFAEDCHVHIVSWGAFAALTLHSFLDGMAISIAFNRTAVLGEVVSYAILVHKMTDGMTLSGLLLGSHFSRWRSFLIVGLLGLATPMGAIVFSPFSGLVSESLLGFLLGITAGMFFYIGASDILPRIHREKDILCLAWFLIGLLIGGIHFGGVHR